MNFNLPSAVKGVSELLKTRVLPEVGDNYTANMARMGAALLNISANWVDAAAELRVAENAAIRVLLGEGACLVEDALAARLADAGKSSDPGLKISVLDAENHRLRLLLIALQEHLEARDAEAPRALGQRIWCLLEQIELDRAPRE